MTAATWPGMLGTALCASFGATLCASFGATPIAAGDGGARPLVRIDPARERAFDPCAPIVAACQRSGFIRGSGVEGNRLEADCVRPIVQGRVPAHVSKPLPPHDARLGAACRMEMR